MKYLYEWRELWKLHSVKMMLLSVVTGTAVSLMMLWQPSLLGGAALWIGFREILTVVTIYLRNVKQEGIEE